MVEMSPETRKQVIGTDARGLATGDAGRATMKFKRLLTVGLMALFCAGTATAASQLNSIQVTPKENTATVNLRTTGSFTHKEYRPDDHLLMVDLAGVTPDAAVERTAALSSAVLKSYKLSSYTSASGSNVTRIEFELGEQVTADVNDVSGGLQILMTGGGPFTADSSGAILSAASSSASAPAESTAVTPKPALAETANPPRQAAVSAVKDTGTQQSVPVNAATPATGHSPRRPAESSATSRALAPTTIRNVRVQQGHGTLDVIIEGPSSAQPFLLKNPDRLVMDFSNAVVRPSVRNIPVHTKDVLQVRVGRFQAEPPVTRIVIDLGGPRAFDVVPSANQVIVRVKSERAETFPAPLKPAPAPISVVVTAPAPAPVMAVQSSASQNSNSDAANAAPPRASRANYVAVSASNGNSQLRDQQIVDPNARAVTAADTMAASPEGNKPPVEMARLNPPAPVQLSGSAVLAPPTTSKYTGEPISVNLKDVDLKDFFRLIHEISGLNIVLDPSVKGTVTLVLDDVPWDQALDIVLKNNQLDRELQGKVLRIASVDTLRREAVDRRAHSEAVALAVDRQTITRFLSYASAKSIVPIIKKFLTARGDVIQDERTNALIISDIPSVLPTLDNLISKLDRKSQEVEIEVRVVSASRSFTRDLGMQLGFNWGNGVTSFGGSNPSTTTTTTTGTTTTTTSNNPSTIPLFSNLPVTEPTSGFSISNITRSYGIDAILTAAETHNLAKVLSRPRVVTQSNVKAEVKQGVKIPVYTAQTANANASVSYIDAVLRLSVTPQITVDNTIFLTVDVENTQPSGELNDNYILTTQQATTQVLVTDGGTVVIGGVIQTTNTVSVSQTPWLGDIPWLGNLFKQRSVSTQTEELIFFITPKIIQT
jgi:type IV pilus assembly protein PilQ